MRIVLRILPVAFAVCAHSAWAQQDSGRGTIFVRVSSTADEKAARRLASAVMDQLGRDSRFTQASATAPAMLTIALPNRIGWKRRLDWTEITYQARLTTVDGDSRVIEGNCWNWNLAICAKQIADAGAEVGANP